MYEKEERVIIVNKETAIERRELMICLCHALLCVAINALSNLYQVLSTPVLISHQIIGIQNITTSPLILHLRTEDLREWFTMPLS